MVSDVIDSQKPHNPEVMEYFGDMQTSETGIPLLLLCLYQARFLPQTKIKIFKF